MEQDLQLVPAGRLGALLSANRRQEGLDLASVAAKSSGAFDLRELEQIERGEVELDKTQIEALTELYRVESGLILPSRSHLVIDLANQQLSVGDNNQSVKSEDEILEQYLSLLYILRDIKPGTELTLRQPDLITLEQALEQSVRDIEQELFSLMTKPVIEERAFGLSQALIVPAAGLLVGMTAFGSLIFLDGSQPSIQTPDVQPVAEVLANPVQIEQAPTPTLPPATSNSEAPRSSNINELTPVEVGRLAEQEIDYDYAKLLPGWSIEYREDRPGFRGLTFTREKRIEIYVDPGESAFSVAGILAHEVGHAIDIEYLDTQDREQWREARDLPNAWWPGNGLSDFHVGAGDFAEAVAFIIADSPSDSEHGDFTPEQVELARELLPNG